MVIKTKQDWECDSKLISTQVLKETYPLRYDTLISLIIPQVTSSQQLEICLYNIQEK